MLHTPHTMAIPLAQRLQVVQTPIMGFVQELIQSNPGTISLGQGLVHYGPPPEVLRAAWRAVQDSAHHKYGFVTGMAALREALLDKLTRENALSPGYEVVVTAGSNMAFFIAMHAITDPGDEIILLRPFYFNHQMAAQIISCTPVVVSCDEGFMPRLDAIERAITPRTRAVVTISPNNPTGVVYPEALLRAINDLCRTRGIYHISDEAYEYFTFDGARHYSPGATPGAAGHTISLFSLSKAYGMAGWRLGYMAAPPELLPALRKIQDTNLICAPLPIQVAALAALEAGAQYCRNYLRPMDTVRQLVLQALEGLGSRVHVSCAQGAFYVFARLRTELTDTLLLRRLIEEHGVAIIPGSTFGQSDGTYIRIAYGALEKETVQAAMGRLCAGLRSLI